MIQNFSLNSIPQIFFGKGVREQLYPVLAATQGEVLLLTGSSFPTRDKVSSMFYEKLMQVRVQVHHYIIADEPTVDYINDLTRNLKFKQIELVVAIGGGSVLDAGKAVSAMLTQEMGIQHYLEGVGDLTYNGHKVPFIAMPTTAGTGSEVTANAVITQPGAQGYKKSLRHARLVPDIAIVDPEFTISCPHNVTAWSGLDALTQLIESYISTNASVFTDSLALQGVGLALPALERVVNNSADIEARIDMSYAAMLSGITLASAGLGLAHGYAQPLGSLFPVPHGVVCGTTMAEVLRVSLEVACGDEKNISKQFINRFAQLSKHALQFKSNDVNELAHSLVERLIELTDKFKVPRLGTYGVTKSDIAQILDLTSLKNHPIQLTREQIRIILENRL